MGSDRVFSVKTTSLPVQPEVGAGRAAPPRRVPAPPRPPGRAEGGLRAAPRGAGRHRPGRPSALPRALPRAQPSALPHLSPAPAQPCPKPGPPRSPLGKISRRSGRIPERQSRFCSENPHQWLTRTAVALMSSSCRLLAACLSPQVPFALSSFPINALNTAVSRIQQAEP